MNVNFGFLFYYIIIIIFYFRNLEIYDLWIEICVKWFDDGMIWNVE